jgi:transcriptional regulator with XRE-family HTH domain
VTTDAERPRLRELRTDLGWTQQELADRISHLAWMERRERVGVNADMVAKWERGVKGVSPRYRELLC